MSAADSSDAFADNNLPISFSNPNYQLDEALSGGGGGGEMRCAADDGGEIGDDYDDAEIYEDVDTGTFTRDSSVKSRRSYNHIDLPSMGLDLTADPTANLPSTPHLSSPDSVAAGDNADERFRCYRGIESNRNEVDETTVAVDDGSSTVGENNLKNISADSNVGGDAADEEESRKIEYVRGPRNDDIYAVVNKKVKAQLAHSKETERAVSPKEEDSTDRQREEGEDEEEKQQKEEKLPAGWEKHEDADGPYYWHIKSGTIQREPPPPQPSAPPTRPPADVSPAPPDGRQSAETAAEQEEKPAATTEEEAAEEGEGSPPPRQVRFAVQSLGWVEISEDDLTPERSSKAVSRCIVDLSLGRNVALDVVGRWGDGKELYMDLDDHSLKLIHPHDLAVLHAQPIHSIRVWGVGRDNGRDFAYVARDRTTRVHMCHVFRCDSPARTIANTLRDICKRIMIERSLAHNLVAPPAAAPPGGIVRRARPTNLPTQNRRGVRPGSAPPQSFPTPMEEPKKQIRAHYLGATQVARPMGIEVINTAIERMIHMSPREMWSLANVAVAPSVITVVDAGNPERVLQESRVRYLSFLGIGREVEYCAYIMHTAQDLFMAHVFHCEPSSGALAKTIEAACKLRYQKCLDAHARDQEEQTPPTTPKSIGMAIKGMLGSLAGRKKSSGNSS
ncbi:PREDICTED: protein Fe65 homolog [Priapulus caudatus]|uniref:Protein Fe65 homolog n=1 Tax=Priapulus caudatus TaxID=37621 RepID=A0ABM1ET90_PRICU|nr:PREDICTED: protein Fe65 homolog [Priapulus caudatus]